MRQTMAAPNDWDDRHGTAERREISGGVWRWRGIRQHKHQLKGIMQNGVGVDFGGAACPLEAPDTALYGVLKTTVVDIHSETITGEAIDHRDLSTIDKADWIFASHSLEHLNDAQWGDFWLNAKRLLMASGGWIIAYGPAVASARRWHPKVHPQHHRLFTLADPLEPYKSNYGPAGEVVPLNQHIADMGFAVEIAEEDDDECVLVVARWWA